MENATSNPSSPSAVPPLCALPKNHASTPLWVRIALLLFCLIAFAAGLELRRWTWDACANIHYDTDIERGYYWGTQAITDGYPNLYDHMAPEQNAASWVWLDYAPLRLLTMEQWAKWTHARFPDAAAWRPDYAFNAPILHFNTLMELAAALGVFMLTRQFGACAWGRPKMRALFAALLVWFNPALILSTHGWPTWDAWVIPFYVFAILAAARDRWFTAGVLIGIGAMFKGQQLFVAPIFILWPLFQRRPRAALRWVIGVTLAIAILALPWLITYLPPGQTTGPRAYDWPAITFALITTTAATLIPYFLTRRQKKIAASILLLPAASSSSPLPSTPPPIPHSAFRIPHFFLLPAATLAATLLLSMAFFHGSHAWIDCAFLYGTHHWPLMTTGPASNLPALLQAYLGWGANPPVSHALRAALAALYLLALLASGIGIARQHRRADPRFLVAVTAPWLMFFCFPAQIHDRYLLFAAGVGAVMAGHTLRMGFLGVFLAIVTFIMTLHAMVARAIGDNQIPPASLEFFKSLNHLLEATHPNIAWPVLICAVVVMWLTIAPRRPQPAAL